VLFCSYKFRSDIQSHAAIADRLGCLNFGGADRPAFTISIPASVRYRMVAHSGFGAFDDAASSQPGARRHLIDVGQKKRRTFRVTPLLSNATSFCLKARRS
jgi:hypothetical protein